jgi:hypothetical protein
MTGALEDYFNNLFTFSRPDNLERVTDAMETRVTRDMYNLLTRKFSREEVLAVALHQSIWY